MELEYLLIIFDDNFFMIINTVIVVTNIFVMTGILLSGLYIIIPFISPAPCEVAAFTLSIQMDEGWGSQNPEC